MKVDFMERSDQWMVEYYTRVAKEAAKYQLLVDFHGAYKPAGLEVQMSTGLLGGLVVLIAAIVIAFLCLRLNDEPVRKWLTSRFLKKLP